MKKKSKIIILLLILSMLLSVSAVAATNSSAYINYTSAYISRSGGSLSICFTIAGKNIMDNIGVTTIHLYEKTGNTWYLVKTYSYTDYLYADDMMKSNTSINNSSVPFNGSSTKSYYATLTFYAERNGGYDTYIQDTPEV